ncbi:MAG: hypothetical protein GWN55_17290, partial [Phycisphaerae bacterium]|nr:hypothetical protein [candidate division KSB1 bacterium]NIV03045.1 hypothetical protein [Phycisphaerae bacterium]NIS28376.1 hypothetical protein [candidate division KSB1 bacterium]NIT75257.1 hypothetical protein [candidate division KSB1 bacterium]NIU29109.1 hypothetical protein [candidate division KSB1 bacterium]
MIRILTLIFLLVVTGGVIAGDIVDPLASKEKMDRYKKIYSLAPVKALRKILDQYRAGKTSGFLPSTVAEMKKVNQKYFDNRFTVYNIATTWGGMIQINVVFQKMSDDIFTFAIKENSDHSWSLMYFKKQNVKKET